MGNQIILPTGTLTIEGSTKDVSDGNHTFAELYEHRILLFINLMLLSPNQAWKAKLHHDGTIFDESFIAGIQLPQGQITYHLPLEYWTLLNSNKIKTLTYAPEWDGHSSFDVLERLEAYASELC